VVVWKQHQPGDLHSAVTSFSSNGTILNRKPGAFRSNRRGFTLMEIVIAVAILALFAAVVAPLVYKHLEESKVVSAQAEVKTIGEALQHFRGDTNQWPVFIAGAQYGRLGSVGSSSCGGGGGEVGAGDPGVPTSASWSTFGSIYPLMDVLVYNQVNGAGAELFTPSSVPGRNPGWHGPYMTEMHGDPWGGAYVCNITWGAFNPGQTGYRNDAEHNILVLSAGPNGVFETPFGDNSSVVHEEIGGDDIGFVVRLARP
jgi:prepilin-type N-terminal cleavage/methylation domain-containing protein